MHALQRSRLGTTHALVRNGVKNYNGVKTVDQRSEKIKMVCSADTKQQIVFLDAHNYKPPTIEKILFEKEGIVTTQQGVAQFLKETGTIKRRHGSSGKLKASAQVRQIVEEQMRKDDETTAVQLNQLLTSKGYRLSLSTILRLDRCKKTGRDRSNFTPTVARACTRYARAVRARYQRGQQSAFPP